MAVNFGLNQPTLKQLKKQSLFNIHEKKLAVFPNKVQSLLLGKNLKKENFISVAL